MKNPLPANLNMMTLQPWGNGKVVMRLEHIFEAGEDSSLAQPVPIELLDILAAPIANIKETDLSGSQVTPVRLQWKHADKSNEISSDASSEVVDESKAVINIRPSEIRTFVLTLA
jgi:hypothetical protein